jgi:hypothetical protein
MMWQTLLSHLILAPETIWFSIWIRREYGAFLPPERNRWLTGFDDPLPTHDTREGGWTLPGMVGNSQSRAFGFVLGAVLFAALFLNAVFR